MHHACTHTGGPAGGRPGFCFHCHIDTGKPITFFRSLSAPANDDGGRRPRSYPALRLSIHIDPSLRGPQIDIYTQVVGATLLRRDACMPTNALISAPDYCTCFHPPFFLPQSH